MRPAFMQSGCGTNQANDGRWRRATNPQGTGKPRASEV